MSALLAVMPELTTNPDTFEIIGSPLSTGEMLTFSKPRQMFTPWRGSAAPALSIFLLSLCSPQAVFFAVDSRLLGNFASGVAGDSICLPSSAEEERILLLVIRFVAIYSYNNCNALSI
jgi:hypothetical protein